MTSVSTTGDGAKGLRAGLPVAPGLVFGRLLSVTP